MGIRGLTSYLKKNSSEFFELHPLRDTYLVIDGVNICLRLYTNSDKQGGVMGGQYDLFAEAAEDFFKALLSCEICPIVVFDSVNTLNKEMHLQRIRDRHERTVFEEGQCLFPDILCRVFINILTSLKIKYVQIIGEADETMVAIAKALNCPVLSADGDFFLQGTKFIPLDDFDKAPTAINKSADKLAMMCLLYDITRLCRKFASNGKMLDQSVLQLALPILGNKYGRSNLDENMMAPFLEKLERDYTTEATNYYHKKIERTFKWLSQYSSITEAIQSILICIKIDHRQKILADIRTFMSEVGVGSPLGIKVLDFPEDITSKILNENAKKVLQLQETMSQLKTLMKLDVDEEKEDHHSGEQKLVAIFPEWMINDLLTGKMSPTPFDMFKFSIGLLISLIEDENQPPVGLVSLPILEEIYRIILSLGNEHENVLNIYYTKGQEILEMKRLIRRSSFDLRNIESYKGSERKHVIDKVLGIVALNRLSELPNCWRLYVATMVFWLKQDIEPKKKEAHISAIILAMLQGRVDEEIGVIRSMLIFQQKFGNIYKDIIKRPTSTNKLMEGLSLRDTMRLITKNECIAAAPFFIMHSNMTSREFNQLDRNWRKTVHTFTQFHICLKNALILNSILQYPYMVVPLHRMYNGLLFYNLFRDFEAHENAWNNDVDGWLRGQFKHSPGLLKSFFVLRDIVLSMLSGKS